MLRNKATAATAAQLEFALKPVASQAALNTIVFDIQSGMPLTQAAARSMGSGSIRSALAKALETLPGRGAAAPTAAPAVTGGASALDSLEVVWLLSKFDKLFDKPLLDLTKVPAPRWSTLDAVADLLQESIGARP